MARRGKGNDNSRRKGAPTKSARPVSDPAPKGDSEGSTIEVKHPPRKTRPQNKPAQGRDRTTHEAKESHERSELRGGMAVEQRVKEFVPAWAHVASQAEAVDMKYILDRSDDEESDHHLYYQVDAGDEVDRADDPAPAKQAKACPFPEMATQTFSTLHLSIAEFLVYAHVQRLVAGAIVVRPVEVVDSVTGEVRVLKPPCAETIQCNTATAPDLVKLKEYVSGNVYEVKA
ncbi:hypothetical protein PRZ48_007413 [Zasmidium cellare]|uniref:Uncharacterized protein n=1 Tax=Zasmidium cellare TaxID=395010 RepID=A0ABR0EJ95_ZASCE|nr:hypothetical protein PRZ48_007413 [Zasmidium cellare]